MIWYFYTLWIGYLAKSSYHLLSYKVLVRYIIGYILCAVTYLFYKWKFVPLKPLHLFGPPHSPPLLWQPSVYSVSISIFVSFFFFFKISSVSEIISICFLCLTYFTHLAEKLWHPILVLLAGKSHGQRSLVGCSPWVPEELDTTERLHFHFPLSRIGEGNGGLLQCSCLEDPRDGGAWWAAVYGVAQSRTRLKWLSSSSSMVPSRSIHITRFFFFLFCGWVIFLYTNSLQSHGL